MPMMRKFLPIPVAVVLNYGLEKRRPRKELICRVFDLPEPMQPKTSIRA